ncbi:MAG TPA: PAS domain S-box protein [Bdellovibrionota bacterium]|nr:PAS domain S-box protein [Bdellovibrionota bacterium]
MKRPSESSTGDNRPTERSSPREPAINRVTRAEIEPWDIIDSTNDPIFVHDWEGRMLEVNRASCEVLGYTQDELLRLRLEDIDTPEHAADIPNRKNEIKRKRHHVFESRHRRKDGTSIPVEVSAKLLTYNGKEFVVGIARDMTDRKNAARMLADSERRFRSAFESSFLGSALVSPQGCFMDVNNAFCSMLGFSKSELIGLHIEVVTFPGDVALSKQILRELVEGKIQDAQFEKRYQHKNGSQVWAEVSVTLTRDSGGNPDYFIAQIHNINERKLAEAEKSQIHAQLIHSAKLASIGTLAAGVAHEINNPLTIIQGNIEFLRDYLSQIESPGQALQLLEKQEKGVRRIATIVNGLRTYARPDTDFIASVDLHKTIGDTVSLVGNIYLKSGIDLKSELKSTYPFVKGSVGKIQQITMNLLSNAKDAIEKTEAGGMIRIETDDAADSVILRISDNGCGIEPRFMDKIFDAFYTTKPPGKGTGLGLSIVQSLVESMDAKIELDSQPGLGTSFTLRFQPAPKAESQPDSTKASLNQSVRGRALVVDDEAPIREILKSYLEELGLEVFEAEDGMTALELVSTHTFEYVLTDIKMPKMGGDKLLLAIKSLKSPSPKLIVITGGILTEYTREQREAIRSCANGFLNKPFSRETLHKVISPSCEK